MNKEVAWEEWQLEKYFAVFPQACGLILRQKVLHAATRKLICHPLLMVRASVHRIPSSLRCSIRLCSCVPDRRLNADGTGLAKTRQNHVVLHRSSFNRSSINKGCAHLAPDTAPPRHSQGYM